MSQTAVQVQERPGERASALLPSYWCREYKIDRSEGSFWLNGKTAAVKKVPFSSANFPAVRSAGAGSSPAGERGCLRTVKPMPALRARPLRSYVSAALVPERGSVSADNISLRRTSALPNRTKFVVLGIF